MEGTRKYVITKTLLFIAISLTIDVSFGQSWRKNDRIETFRTRHVIGKQFFCPDGDVTFELVTGKSCTIRSNILQLYFFINSYTIVYEQSKYINYLNPQDTSLRHRIPS